MIKCLVLPVHRIISLKNKQLPVHTGQTLYFVSTILQSIMIHFVSTETRGNCTDPPSSHQGRPAASESALLIWFSSTSQKHAFPLDVDVGCVLCNSVVDRWPVRGAFQAVACWEEFQAPCLYFVEAEKSKAHHTAGPNSKRSMISQPRPSDAY